MPLRVQNLAELIFFLQPRILTFRPSALGANTTFGVFKASFNKEVIGKGLEEVTPLVEAVDESDGTVVVRVQSAAGSGRFQRYTGNELSITAQSFSGCDKLLLGSLELLQNSQCETRDT